MRNKFLNMLVRFIIPRIETKDLEELEVYNVVFNELGRRKDQNYAKKIQEGIQRNRDRERAQRDVSYTD